MATSVMQEFQHQYNDLMTSFQAFGNLNTHPITPSELAVLAVQDSKSLKEEGELYKIIEKYDSFKKTVQKLKQIYNAANLQAKNDLLQATPYAIAFLQGKNDNLETILDKLYNENIRLQKEIQNQRMEKESLLKQMKTATFSGPDLEKILQNIDNLSKSSNQPVPQSTPINRPRLYQLQKDELLNNHSTPNIGFSPNPPRK